MSFSYIDMHCDTLLKTFVDGKLFDCPEHMLDIKRMAAAEQAAQFFAVYFPEETRDGYIPQDGETIPYPEDSELFDRMRALLFETVNAHPDVIRMAYSAEDIERNAADGVMSAMLTIEDARAVRGDIAALERFYCSGVRAMSLTWNHANCFGYPNSPEPAAMAIGLTDFGREAIYEMNRLGILIDVSHLSDGGFWDVAKLTEKPFVATHSNCRALCAHPRNLTDAMIRALSEKGGAIGVNFVPDFLSEDGKGVSRVDDLCRHIMRIIAAGGEDCPALGTDFDGFEGELEIGGPEQMDKLFEALKTGGLTERRIEKLACKNALRVLRDAFGR